LAEKMDLPVLTDKPQRKCFRRRFRQP